MSACNILVCVVLLVGIILGGLWDMSSETIIHRPNASVSNRTVVTSQIRFNENSGSSTAGAAPSPPAEHTGSDTDANSAAPSPPAEHSGSNTEADSADSGNNRVAPTPHAKYQVVAAATSLACLYGIHVGKEEHALSFAVATAVGATLLQFNQMEMERNEELQFVLNLPSNGSYWQAQHRQMEMEMERSDASYWQARDQQIEMEMEFHVPAPVATDRNLPRTAKSKPFSEGDTVLYSQTDGTQINAKILKIHNDLEHCVTILLDSDENGGQKERQTTLNRIKHANFSSGCVLRLLRANLQDCLLHAQFVADAEAKLLELDSRLAVNPDLYDNPNHSPWRLKKDGKTIQETLQDALTSAAKTHLVASSRVNPGWFVANQPNLIKSCAKRNDLQHRYNLNPTIEAKAKLRKHQNNHKTNKSKVNLEPAVNLQPGLRRELEE